ncbi:MAG: hypothetical protein Q8P22_08820 [Chloroflexota bacterium]|nr:hypothetical protein [Chloroflexota bacterium]
MPPDAVLQGEVWVAGRVYQDSALQGGGWSICGVYLDGTVQERRGVPGGDYQVDTI